MKSKSIAISAIVFGLATVLGATCSLAQPAPVVTPAIPGDNAAPKTELRVYDVRDLLLSVQDYPMSGALVPPTRIGQQTKEDAAGVAQVLSPAQTEAARNYAMAEQAASAAGKPAPTPPWTPSPIDQLQAVIKNQVDPTSWKENGGTAGSMEVMNGRLFVTQTAQNQSAVENILTEVRKGQITTVRIRADWVVLAPGEIDSLLKNGRDDKSAVPEVSRDLLDKLAGGHIHYCGQISCFSGQTVHLASGRTRTTITSTTPVVATSAIAYDPTVEFVQYGLSLQVMPTMSTDSATLDLLSIASDPANVGSSATTEPAPIDRVEAVVQHFHTTVQVPLNKPVLVGGMTVEPQADQPAGNQLYLIVEADAQP